MYKYNNNICTPCFTKKMGEPTPTHGVEVPQREDWGALSIFENCVGNARVVRVQAETELFQSSVKLVVPKQSAFDTTIEGFV